jgi:hypothetical protein
MDRKFYSQSIRAADYAGTVTSFAIEGSTSLSGEPYGRIIVEVGTSQLRFSCAEARTMAKALERAAEHGDAQAAKLSATKAAA